MCDKPECPRSEVIWNRFVEVHQLTKKVLFLSEETGFLSDPDYSYRTLAQVYKEHRDALDHLVRAKAHQLEEKDGNENVATVGLEKAFAHVYRGFFDAGDCFGLMCRLDIATLLRPFSGMCVNKVIPNYYTEILPAINGVSETASECRGRKDIVRIMEEGDDALRDVIEYSDA